MLHKIHTVKNYTQSYMIHASGVREMLTWQSGRSLSEYVSRARFSKIRQSIRGRKDLDVSDRGQSNKAHCTTAVTGGRSSSQVGVVFHSWEPKPRGTLLLRLSNLDVVLPALATWPSSTSSPDSRKCDSTSTGSTRSAWLPHSILTRAY